MVAIFTGIIFVVFACLLTIDAMKNGVGKKRWFAIGLLIGPFAWPMLNVKKQMRLRQQSGTQIAFFKP